MTIRFFIFLALGMTPLSFVYSDELWEEAFTSLTEAKYEKSIELHEKWLEQPNLQSPDAHYHLAASYYKKQNIEKSVYHLMRSIKQRQDPFRLMTEIQTLNEIQGTLGIKDGPAGEFIFFFHSFYSKNCQILLACTTFWLLLFYFLIKKRSRYSLVSALFLCIIQLALHFYSQSTGTPALLSSNEKSIKIWKDSSSLENEQLIEMPAGTLVLTKELKNKKYSISSPFVGWVDSENLLKFF